MQKYLNRLQVMLDAKTLGVTIRDLASMVNPDAEISRKVYAIQTRILKRYGCRDVRGCELKIAIILREKI